VQVTRLLNALVILCALPACAGLVTSGALRLTDDLDVAIRTHDDPETVREAVAAYMLLLDGLIEGDPDDPDLALAGAQLYGAYVSAFVDDEERARRLAARARDYGQRALCGRISDLCEALHAPFDEFEREVGKVGRGDVETLFGFGASWAVWAEANSDDWKAIADVPRIEAVMRGVVTLDDSYERGAAHLYLGVLMTLLPPSLGGRSAEAQEHFERAIALSQGRDLMAKVLYAERYARLLFDRDLHDRARPYGQGPVRRTVRQAPVRPGSARPSLERGPGGRGPGPGPHAEQYARTGAGAASAGDGGGLLLGTVAARCAMT
jgi:hypothetical protein